MVAIAQLVRVSDCGSEGRRFEQLYQTQKNGFLYKYFDESLALLIPFYPHWQDGF